MEEQHIDLALSCDDSYLLLSSDCRVSGTVTDSGLMTDENYAEELQFQEAIMASIISSKNPFSERKGSVEVGESSQTMCEICAERKDGDQMFAVQNCDHSFCTDCIAKHVEVKLQKGPSGNHEKVRSFSCPGLNCSGILEIDTCREIVPNNFLSMWEEFICESLIDESQKFYCPYKDCSRMMVNDFSNDDREIVIRESECPFCHRLFCAHCRVVWHSGIGCEEFLKLNEDEREIEDRMVHALAKENMWQRCPKCKFFVEKTEGCLHMTCRCGYEFCYACGATWTSTHGGCL